MKTSIVRTALFQKGMAVRVSVDNITSVK